MANFSQSRVSIRISLLGTPQVSLHGKALHIPRRQVRALLYRLAAEPRPLNRSYLSYLFWADYPESTARQNPSRLQGKDDFAWLYSSDFVAQHEGLSWRVFQDK